MENKDTNWQGSDPIFGGPLGELETAGKEWAAYGLRAGATALQTSMSTLSQVAGLLGSLAEAFDSKRSTDTPPEPR